MLAGSASASEACRYFRINRSTYGSHEIGMQDPFADHVGGYYGTAFGVPSDWLLLVAEEAGLPAAAIVEGAEGSSSAATHDGVTFSYV